MGQELYDWMNINNKSVHEASIHFNVDVKDARVAVDKIHRELKG